jgi:hypothetical protein
VHHTRHCIADVGEELEPRGMHVALVGKDHKANGSTRIDRVTSVRAVRVKGGGGGVVGGGGRGSDVKW